MCITHWAWIRLVHQLVGTSPTFCGRLATLGSEELAHVRILLLTHFEVAYEDLLFWRVLSALFLWSWWSLGSCTLGGILKASQTLQEESIIYWVYYSSFCLFVTVSKYISKQMGVRMLHKLCSPLPLISLWTFKTLQYHIFDYISDSFPRRIEINDILKTAKTGHGQNIICVWSNCPGSLRNAEQKTTKLDPRGPQFPAHLNSFFFVS